MPLVKVDPLSRRNGPRVSIGDALAKKIDEVRGDLSRPEFLCRAGYYLVSRTDLLEDPGNGWTEDQQNLDRNGYRFAIDPDLAREFDEVRGDKSRTYIINKAGWVYVSHIEGLKIQEV